MQQIKRVLAIKISLITWPWLLLFSWTEKLRQVFSPKAKAGSSFSSPKHWWHLKFHALQIGNISSRIKQCRHVFLRIIIFGSVKYCTTQPPNVVHACGNQCRKVSRTAARQFPALNFTVRELETLKYKSYSNIVSCWFDILFLALLKEFYVFETLRRISLYGCWW